MLASKNRATQESGFIGKNFYPPIVIYNFYIVFKINSSFNTKNDEKQDL
jgi:hypothetical protein